MLNILNCGLYYLADLYYHEWLRTTLYMEVS